jgi:hypothetical protein
VAGEQDAWSWTVAQRVPMRPKPGPRVIVVGDHVGAWPTSGEPALVRYGERVVAAVVECVMRFEQREGGTTTAYSWGLSLREITLDDVPIGAVVTSEPSKCGCVASGVSGR